MPDAPRRPPRTPPTALLATLVVALAVGGGAPALAADPPALVFEAPERFAPLVRRLEEADRGPLREGMELVGLDEPGPPIRVVLAPEGSAAARRAPSWGVGYAVGGAGLVVLLPERVPAYPDRTLEEVLRHEVAHVLVARAAGRHGLPRWFHEGVAMLGGHDWRWVDRGRVVYAAMRHDVLALDLLDERFARGAGEAQRAYALAGAFVRHLEHEHGDGTVAAILAGVARGERFRRAFRAATGVTLAEAERGFWRQLDWWNRWVPFLTSSALLWILVTTLALLAFHRRRQRDEALRRRWAEEESWLASSPHPPSTSASASGDDLVN